VTLSIASSERSGELVAQAPVAIARQTIALHSKSFALASRLLGPRLRDQTAIVYTWCRRTDDAVDEVRADIDTLTILSGELDAAYGGTASDRVLAAFGEVARDREIPRAYPDAMLAGMAMDLADVRYRTVDDLVTYAYRVAGVVGLMMTHVFGVLDDDAVVPAAHLGIAMQLTNVCRDVAEDWRRGRLYLPDELLAAHGAAGLAGELPRPPAGSQRIHLPGERPLGLQRVRMPAAELFAHRRGGRAMEVPASARGPVAATVAELLALADRYYRSADRGMRALPWRAAVAVRAARSIYSAIGGRIARAGHDVTAGRAVVPRASKLVLAGAACARTALSLPLRALSRGRAHPPRRILELDDVPRL
jgi:phytoene synthase